MARWCSQRGIDALFPRTRSTPCSPVRAS